MNKLEHAYGKQTVYEEYVRFALALGCLHLIMGAGHTFGAKQPWEESEMPTDFQEAVQCTLSFIQE